MQDTNGKEERIEEIRITGEKVVLVIIFEKKKHSPKNGKFEVGLGNTYNNFLVSDYPRTRTQQRNPRTKVENKI